MFPCLLVPLFLACFAPLARPGDELTASMADELNREMAELAQSDPPPYFISFAVDDVTTASASASFGALTAADENTRRLMSVQVRVGDYQLDSSHELRGDPLGQGLSYFPGKSAIAKEHHPAAIRNALWRETNRQFREAVSRFAKVKANVAVKVEAEDQSADFSKESATVHEEPPLDFHAKLGGLAPWRDRVKRFSAMLLEDPHLFGGNATFTFQVSRKRLVTSEGTRLSHNRTYARLFISAFTKAEDGMELPLYLSYFAFEPSGLPAPDRIEAEIRIMMGKLKDLRTAPLADPYTGPAMLSGRAAGVFFHEVFGHRIEGHRMKMAHNAQTFKEKVGESLLPATLQVTFDPRKRHFKGYDLVGHYQFDDEGVAAREVRVIEDGVLRNFLVSRTPFEGFATSNGHGRCQAGRRPVSRQSNLMVTSREPLSYEDLRQQLIATCKAQGKAYGLLFQDIQGGFTMTGRLVPNSFNVLPTEVYRVYTDGRPDELVRGVDLIGTPLLVFSKVAAASEDFDVFNGVCGAESGMVPVAAVAPSMLVEQIEVQKKLKSQERPPILARPDVDEGKEKGSKDKVI